MKKTYITLAIIFLLILGAYSYFKGFYNTAVSLQESVTQQWGNVESAYQRRADLIPNLVNTVKGYAAHEKETLEAVVKARAQATQTKIDANNLTPEQLQKFQQSQGALANALKSLLLVVERYPDLKADQHFLELQSQLEGTENRINVERNRFNEVVSKYNKHIRVFPNNLMARMFGFEPKPYFQAAKGAEKAPEVKF